MSVRDYQPTGAYRQSAGDVVDALGAEARRGLSDEEARARLEAFGRNELPAEPPVPWWRHLLAQFTDILVLLLLIATAISAGLWVYQRETALPYEAIAIFASCCSTRPWATSRSRAPQPRSRRSGGRHRKPDGPGDGENRLAEALYW
jgi:magnesium-transporting ATPase (P-type)